MRENRQDHLKGEASGGWITPTIDINELSKEDSLFAIRLRARKLQGRPFNRNCLLLAAILSTAYAFLTRTPATLLAQRTRELSDLGFNFTIGILGFLIAGFTVFATITKEELFRAMAAFRENSSGLSTLKANLFAFMGVFFDYLCFSSFCLAIKIVASPGGPLVELIDLTSNPSLTKEYLSKIGFAVITTSLVYIIIILKAFVFNIYEMIITTLQWSLAKKPFHPDELKPAPADPATCVG